jgi:hypothetical protein
VSLWGEFGRAAHRQGLSADKDSAEMRGLRGP